jgi:long-chain acyl-CoA synthetase
VDPAIVGTWGAAHRIRGTWAEVAASPAWREFLDREVARTTAGLAPFERPKRWALLPALLTEATGDLTPSLKVKRRAVLTRYADLVDSLYP